MYKEFLRFDDNFRFGVSTASYQIEGGYNSDNKGLSIWDDFAHNPNNIDDGLNADISCNHYNKWEEDLDLMKQMGIKNYRFSIAWTRIFPTGKRDSLNLNGLKFYKTLISEMIKRDITPFITLFHWDLPLFLQQNGGFANKETIEDFFSYAKYVIDELNPIVKNWMTFNEPWVYSFCGHLEGVHAPGIKDLKTALQVTHNILLSHAKIVEYVKDNYDDLEIGIVNNLEQVVSASKKEEDLQAAKRWKEAFNNWYLDPLFKARYPKDLERFYTKHPKLDGGIENVMPKYNQDEMDYICKNRGDFLGVNYYTRRIISFDKTSYHLNAKNIFRPMIQRAEFDSWEINPEAFFDLLISINEEYGSIKIYITENGTSGKDVIDENGCVHDDYRIEYFKRHLAAIYQARKEGVNIQGYFAWSFIDNFEWAFGYTKRFGLVFCDYEDEQRRVVKDSGHFYSNIIRKRGYYIT